MLLCYRSAARVALAAGADRGRASGPAGVVYLGVETQVDWLASGINGRVLLLSTVASGERLATPIATS
jgi:hypothetical protein